MVTDDAEAVVRVARPPDARPGCRAGMRRLPNANIEIPSRRTDLMPDMMGQLKRSGIGDSRWPRMCGAARDPV
jgi:hypothetical protein